MQKTENTIQIISRPAIVGSIAITSITNTITPWGN